MNHTQLQEQGDEQEQKQHVIDRLKDVLPPFICLAIMITVIVVVSKCGISVPGDAYGLFVNNQTSAIINRTPYEPYGSFCFAGDDTSNYQVMLLYAAKPTTCRVECLLTETTLLLAQITYHFKKDNIISNYLKSGGVTYANKANGIIYSNNIVKVKYDNCTYINNMICTSPLLVLNNCSLAIGTTLTNWHITMDSLKCSMATHN